jgi:hypothetical protein
MSEVESDFPVESPASDLNALAEIRIPANTAMTSLR